MTRLAPSLLAAVVVVVGCSGADIESRPPADLTATTTPAAPGPTPVTASELCRAGIATVAGTVAAADLTEASGLAASRRRPGVLWAHNDSGSAPEVFAIGEGGSDLGRVSVTGASAFDWEDITLGQSADGPDQLYLADIGDNAATRQGRGSPVRIYRVPEPDPTATVTEPVVEFDLAYADGPRDAETLIMDPVSGDLFVVSKQRDGAPAGLYRVPTEVTTATTAPAEPLTMERVADLPATADTLVTGGDVSADGTMVALRTYPAVWLWDRDPERSLAETLVAPPMCRIPVVEPQGEAVAFAADGRGFVTVSEGENPPVLVRRVP